LKGEETMKNVICVLLAVFMALSVVGYAEKSGD